MHPMPALACPAWRALPVFLAVFALLQWGWGEARDTWLERVPIHDATARGSFAFRSSFHASGVRKAAAPRCRRQAKWPEINYQASAAPLRPPRVRWRSWQ